MIPITEKEYNELNEKADKWDQYAIYAEKGAEILVEDLIMAYEHLESIKRWYQTFNQNIDSEAAKDELREILKTARSSAVDGL